jgi:hypothetical protein
VKHYTREAQVLFRDFAKRHALTIERVDDSDLQLLMRVPRQPGLSFKLMLGQNGDELNIGFERFWSCIYPFQQKRDLVASLLDGIVTGDCRLAIHRQLGIVVRRVLECQTNDEWEPIYHAFGFRIPFIGTSVSYVRNDCLSASSISN